MFHARPVRRMLSCRPVLWYAALKEQLVLLVIVRDPDGQQPDDFFFTTDLSLGAQAVAERALALGLGSYSLVFTWFLTTSGTQIQAPDHPWYPNRSSVSFLDALAHATRPVGIWHPAGKALPKRSSRLPGDVRNLHVVAA